jgi:hypothetical protein
LNREFKNLRRGVLKIPSPIEIGLGIFKNAAAQIFGLLFIGYLNLVLDHYSEMAANFFNREPRNPKKPSCGGL